MNAKEIEAIEQAVRKLATPAIIGHASERMAQKSVTAKDLEIVLKYGQVIEAHNEAGELRVVIRHAWGRPKQAVLIVIALASATIVTTWRNAGSDGHATLNWNLYGWNVNLLNLL